MAQREPEPSIPFPLVSPAVTPASDRTVLSEGARQMAERAPTVPDESDVRPATAPAPPKPIPTGPLIGDAYRMVRPLGQGAMGRVALAYDERLHRNVALKLIRPELLNNEEQRERFEREARSMARINHPHVLQIHAYGEHDGTPYFAMEFVDGMTLDTWAKRNKNNATWLEDACAILEDVCRGVSAIHAADTVHFDLKPSNILVGHDGRVRVGDLGLANVLRGLDGPRRDTAGTPLYMAPEVVLQTKVEPELMLRADVYSLGCVAYELLTGTPPFTGDSLPVMMKHCTVPPDPPSRRRPELPPAFDRVLLRAIAKDPRERTPDIETFRRELSMARDGKVEPVRILLADDDEDSRVLLQTTLLREFPEADIECAENGRAALDAFDRNIPSVVLLDLNMPELDGLEVTALLRAREVAYSVPILVLTGAGGGEEWRRLSALGADGVLLKPVHREDLVAMLRRTLRERSRSIPPSERSTA